MLQEHLNTHLLQAQIASRSEHVPRAGLKCTHAASGAYLNAHMPFQEHIWLEAYSLGMFGLQ